MLEMAFCKTKEKGDYFWFFKKKTKKPKNNNYSVFVSIYTNERIIIS